MNNIQGMQYFSNFLKQNFTVSLNGESTTLELSQVAAPERSPANYECFTLLFKGDKRVYLEQGIYQFAADEFQPVDLFLVPVAGDETGYDYEVIINRKLEAASPS